MSEHSILILAAAPLPPESGLECIETDDIHPILVELNASTFMPGRGFWGDEEVEVFIPQTLVVIPATIDSSEWVKAAQEYPRVRVFDLHELTEEGNP